MSGLRRVVTGLILVGAVTGAWAADVTGRWKGSMVFLPPKGFQVDQSLQEYQAAVGRMEAILLLRRDRTFLMTIRHKPGYVGKPDRVSMNPGTLSGSWSLKAGVLKLTMTKRNGKKPNGPAIFNFLLASGGQELVQDVPSGMKTTFVR